ncbi:MAG TPA: alpha/beta fold hydrolase [Propionibacteriaceae bacterium]|nr:alpha/beta fold hydrolase [Propionibacteriaceae bacterium]
MAFSRRTPVARCSQTPDDRIAAIVFVLVHGAGSSSAHWYLVTPRLEQAGHQVIAVDLPNWPGATLADQADAIVAAAEGTEHVVLVAQSMGGFSAPLACDRLPVDHLVLLNAMIPLPGETAGQWWDNTGQAAAVRANDLREGRDPEAGFDPATTFFHDLPAEVLEQVLESESAEPAASLFEVPFDRPGWPDVPTTVLAGRDDRLFPFAFQRQVAAERLGLKAEPVPGGHLAALSQPEALVGRLLRMAETIDGRR